MALINIEYGSLASSDTMNKNFMYLEDKIAENSETVSTSIASILSNIATINSRLAEITENVFESEDSLTAKLEDYKNKTKLLVKKSSIIPNWQAYQKIALDNEFTIPSNGYLLIIPIGNAQGSIVINDVIVELKAGSGYDNAAELMTIPVFKDDVVTSAINLYSACFVPSKEITIEDF